MLDKVRSTVLMLSPNARGALWILMGGFFFTIMVALIKDIGDEIPVVQILFIRQLVMAITVSPLLIHNFPEVFRTRYPVLHGARVLLALCAMTMGFTAVVHLPLAEATALGFSKTMFVTILAVIALHEIAGARRWIVVFVGFLGVLVMLRPTVAPLDIYALMALVSAMMAGAVMVIIRKVSQHDRPVTILSIQAIFVGLLMGLPCALLWVTPNVEQMMILAAIGLTSVVGQYCNIRGFKSGEASAVAPMEYMRLVFAVIFGLVFFAELPDAVTLVGALMIAGSSLYAIRAEQRSTA